MTTNRVLQLSALVALAVAVGAAPAMATTLSLYGTNWDTDQADDAFGGGINFNLPIAQGPLDLDFRAAYYQELTAEPVDALFDDDEAVFVDDGLKAVPVEVGLRYNFNRDGWANPYVGGGGGYYFLDTDVGEVDDEFGLYGAVGSEFGNSGRGASFFAEANYRKVEGSVRFDPDAFDELDDVDFTDEVPIDLDGFGVNVGLVWRW